MNNYKNNSRLEKAYNLLTYIFIQHSRGHDGYPAPTTAGVKIGCRHFRQSFKQANNNGALDSRNTREEGALRRAQCEAAATPCQKRQAKTIATRSLWTGIR